MKNLSKQTHSGIIKREAGEITASQPNKVDMIAKGVTTAVTASAIVQAGRGLAGTLVKSPWVMFGLGVAVGVLSAKYSKEIIALSNQAAEEGKGFIARQKEGLKDMLALDQENADTGEE